MNNAGVDLTKLKRYSLHERMSKVHTDDAARIVPAGGSIADLFASFPKTLKAKDLVTLIDAVVSAHRTKRGIILGMGAHVIKCGLSPLVNNLIARGVITHLVVNGACAVHDFELALAGNTSEDVGPALNDGTFGMAKETGTMINEAVKKAANGFGDAIGDMIMNGDFPHRDMSIFCTARNHGVPVSVTVAIGTDIVHQHPEADGAAIGRASLHDFRKFTDALPTLHDGGVFITFGSAVLIPEVFLKALTVARNIAGPITGFTTAVFDMNMQYRESVNIVSRPTAGSGKGYYFTGHHEIMLPLLHAGIMEKLG
ncbi:MAG: hypothetical protein HZC28_20175 [Spirochaetes bacterium]|nr:hypothetical protein [Spirochaetota bacterium]